MGVPYKAAHDKLVAGIGTAAAYHADWRPAVTSAIGMVTATGFDPKHAGAAEAIRKKVLAGSSEAVAIRAGANGSDAAGVKRALSLKTLRHLHLKQTFGRQKVWILSLPPELRGFPLDYADKSAGVVDLVLGTSGERFSEVARKDLSEASQLGLAWVQKAMIVAGAPMEHEHRKLFRRWFVPAGTADETAKITSWAATLSSHLTKIAAGLKAGEVILTDSPYERGTGSSLEKAEAFVYTADDLIVVYVEDAFFTGANTLSGKTNWARILVHELTHAYAKTKDHAYSWQGLLPRDDDALKVGIDARLALNSGFAAVRTLTYDQCITNADSWAFFCADAGGALSDSDRMQALGKRLYDRGGVDLDQAAEARLKAFTRVSA